MYRIVLTLLIMFVPILWLAFLVLLFLPESHPIAAWWVAYFERPGTLAEAGDAFGVLNALFSSLALVLAVAALVVQSRLQGHANMIGGLTTRQQFLIRECDRLEELIQDLKKKEPFDRIFFNNSVAKRKRYMDEIEMIDWKIQGLLRKT